MVLSAGDTGVTKSLSSRSIRSGGEDRRKTIRLWQRAAWSNKRGVAWLRKPRPGRPFWRGDLRSEEPTETPPRCLNIWICKTCLEGHLKNCGTLLGVPWQRSGGHVSLSSTELNRLLNAGLLRTFIMLMYTVSSLGGALLYSISEHFDQLSSRSAPVDDL